MNLLLRIPSLGQKITHTTIVENNFSKVFLEYLKVLTSFSCVSLIIFLIVIWLYKKEIRELLTRLQNLEMFGVKTSFTTTELKKLAETALAAKIEALGAMPDSLEKDKQAAELAKELEALQKSLKVALDVAASAAKNRGNERLNKVIEEVEELRVGEACKNLVLAHIKQNGIHVSSYGHGKLKMFSMKGLGTLYRECAKQAPDLVAEYGEESFKNALRRVTQKLSPVEEKLPGTTLVLETEEPDDL